MVPQADRERHLAGQLAAGPQYVSRGLLNGWWVTWLTGSILSWISMVWYSSQRSDAEDNPFQTTRDDVESMRSALGVHVFSYVVLIAAAILALLLARQITAAQERRAAMGPQGPAPTGCLAPGCLVPECRGRDAGPLAVRCAGPGSVRWTRDAPVPPGQQGQPYPPYGQG
ncbi:DUF4328 domain-containing protein [Streptomyces sp. M19]